MLTLQLKNVLAVKGIYTIDGEKNKMRPSACRLAPDAADSFALRLRDHVVVSDMFRSPEASLNAVKSGRGAKMPGYSGHNYGFSIDIAVTTTMKNLFTNKFIATSTKEALDNWMELHGWFCHRVDHQREHEEWHYNFFGPGMIINQVKTTAGVLEQHIQDVYGKSLLVAPNGGNYFLQTALQKLKLYGGAIDGIIGPRTKTALQLFQKTWDLPQTGKLDKKTERTLAYVTADINIVGAV